MSAFTIHDLQATGTTSYLAFDLIDILRLCERKVRASSWTISNLDCTGDLRDEFNAIGDRNSTVSGDELMRLALGVHQVIDGDFKAFQNQTKRPWLIIGAVDSTLYVVITNDTLLLTAIRKRFKNVRDSPDDVANVEG